MQTNRDNWQFSEFQDKVGWFDVNTLAQSNVWMYVTGVCKGSQSFLYVNGLCVDSTATLLADPSARDTCQNITIGYLATPAQFFFSGKLDEVRISSVSRSADWEKLCYMNQKAVDALINFR